jgi:hypothetical protein
VRVGVRQGTETIVVLLAGRIPERQLDVSAIDLDIGDVVLKHGGDVDLVSSVSVLPLAIQNVDDSVGVAGWGILDRSSLPRRITRQAATLRKGQTHVITWNKRSMDIVVVEEAVEVGEGRGARGGDAVCH